MSYMTKINTPARISRVKTHIKIVKTYNCLGVENINVRTWHGY